MDSIVKNVLYLSPSAGLALAGLGCLWLFSTSTALVSSILLLTFAGVSFYASYLLGKYGFDSLERISKLETQARIEVEKERTSRKISEHGQELQKIQARKTLGDEKLKRDVIGGILKRL